MNWKYPLFAGLTASLFMLGCNSNPVTVPGNDDTPLAFSQDPSGNNPKVDLLFMIDDSGSMAEEQASISNQLLYLATALQQSGIDFHVAVTSTEGGTTNPGGAGNCKVTSGYCLPGQFRNRANPQFFDAAKITAANIKKVLAPIAAYCLADPSQKGAFEAEITSNIGSLADGDIPDPAKLSALNTALAKYAMREVGPVIKRDDYLDPSTHSLDATRLGADLSCLTAVGTNGYGVEKGLGAVVKAVDPNGPNKGLGFVRDNARMVVVFVSDENDCTYGTSPSGIKLNELSETTCGGAICNLLNDVRFPPKLNPLISPEDLAKQFVTNLQKSKGSAGQSFSAKDVSAVAVTGTAKPRPGEKGNTTINYTPKLRAEIKNILGDLTKLEGPLCHFDSSQKSPFDQSKDVKGETAACSSTEFGSSVSGDRYYRFIKNFGQYEPSKDSQEGYMCQGERSVKAVFETINAFVTGAGGDCITNKLLSCDNPGEQCGPEEAPGTCQAYPYDPSSYFCSAAIQYTLSGPDASFTPAVKALCLQNSVASAGGTSSCVIDPSKYEYKQCAGKVKGVTIKMKQSADTVTLQGQNLTQNYKFSGYVPSEDDDTSSP